MAMLSRQAVLAAKCESTAGSDASPSSTADALLVYDLTLAPLSEASSKDRRSVTGGTFHQASTYPGQYRGKASCSVYLSGSGTAGTAPAWMPLLLACGVQQDVTAATNVVVTPSSTQLLGSWSATADKLGHCPVTLYSWNRDIAGDSSGKLAKLLGCMGAAKFEFEIGKAVKLSFDLDGVYQTVTIPGGSFPASFAFTSVATPKSCTNLPVTFTYASTTFSPVVRSFTLNLGTSVAMRERYDVEGGYQSAVIKDMAPTWSAVIEEPASYSATMDWWQAYEDGTPLDSIAIGPSGITGGNIWAFAIPNPTVSKVSRADGDGVVLLNIEGTCATDTYGSDDAWTLTFT